MTPDRRREVGVGLALGALALLAALLVPTYPNYDSYVHLVWGRAVLDGQAPGFEDYAAPTQHPGLLVLCVLLDLLFVGWADRALVLVCVACLVGLAWAVWRLGRACFGVWAGALGALFCGSSFAFGLYAARGYVDVPFLAAVAWAGALEAERPRRGREVQLLLVVAGLLRPEAWVLLGAYWLWCGWRRWGLLVLAAVAPVLWAALDLAVTGDPLHSLRATSALAEELGRERGLANVPGSLVSFLADTARPPVFLAGLIGLALVGAALRGVKGVPPVRSSHVPLALLGAGVLAFVLSGAAGLSILPRYLTVPAVVLCVLAGHAVAGFAALPVGPLRTWWARGAVGAGVVGVAFLAVKLSSFTALANELRFIQRTHRSVVALAADPRVEACPVVSMPTYRLVPDLTFELDASTVRVAARTEAGGLGLSVYVAGSDKAVRRFGRADGVSRGTNVLPAGVRVAQRDDFLVPVGDCVR